MAEKTSANPTLSESTIANWISGDIMSPLCEKLLCLSEAPKEMSCILNDLVQGLLESQDYEQAYLLFKFLLCLTGLSLPEGAEAFVSDPERLKMLVNEMSMDFLEAIAEEEALEMIL